MCINLRSKKNRYNKHYQKENGKFTSKNIRQSLKQPAQLSPEQTKSFKRQKDTRVEARMAILQTADPAQIAPLMMQLK